MTPLVSVIMPAYNARATIIEAVDSALNQTHPAVEIIIVDDGSSDSTLDLLRQHYGNHPQIKLFQQANAGPSAARNHAIRHANGQWLHFLDSDDRLHPTKIARSLARAAEVPNAAVVYGPAIIIDAAGQPIAQQWAFPPLPSGDVFCHWITGTMANGQYGVLPSFMVKTEAVHAVGGFDEAIFGSEDWDMWIKLAGRFAFAALDETLVDYRDHPAGLHRNPSRIALARLKVIQNARRNPRAGECLTPHQWDAAEAGRWHNLAVTHWHANQRAQARQAFAQAQRLYPKPVRTLYSIMTYALPASAGAYLDSLLTRLKRGKSK